jgi:hypothetical protein
MSNLLGRYATRVDEVDRPLPTMEVVEPITQLFRKVRWFFFKLFFMKLRPALPFHTAFHLAHQNCRAWFVLAPLRVTGLSGD